MCIDLYTQDVDCGWSWCWHVCTYHYRWCIMWLLIFRLLSIPHRAWLTIDVYTHARGEGNAGMYVHQAHAHKLVVHIRCWVVLKPMQTYMQRWHMFRLLSTPHRAWVDDWHINTCKGRRQCRHVRTLGFGGHARKTQTFVVNVHRHTGCCRCTHMMMTWVEADADIYAHRLLSTRHCVDDWRVYMH